MEAVTPKKKNCKRGRRGKQSKQGSQTETCDSGSETAGFTSSTGVSDSSMGWRCNKKKGELITKSTSQSLMVKPATPRVWARPSIDGLKTSPIIGIIMRTSTSWFRSLEL